MAITLPQLGIITSDTQKDQAATVVPIDAILGLGALVLGPITVPLAGSQYMAGGPPYWVWDDTDGLANALTGTPIGAVVNGL